MRFPVALHTDDGIEYGVIVPDLPGCFSAGNTLEEALENVLDAIDGHVEILVEDGSDIPAVRPIGEHVANREFAGAVWAFVDAPVEHYLGPAQRINITVPATTLERIDKYAESRGESRSAFLVRAAKAVMSGSGGKPALRVSRDRQRPATSLTSPARGKGVAQKAARKKSKVPTKRA